MIYEYATSGSGKKWLQPISGMTLDGIGGFIKTLS